MESNMAAVVVSTVAGTSSVGEVERTAVLLGITCCGCFLLWTTGISAVRAGCRGNGSSYKHKFNLSSFFSLRQKQSKFSDNCLPLFFEATGRKIKVNTAG